MIISNTSHYRTTDPVTSKIASHKLDYPTKCKEVFRLCKAYGPNFTWKEIHKVSGIDGLWKRFSDLFNIGYIRPTGEVREGCRVFEICKPEVKR